MIQHFRHTLCEVETDLGTFVALGLQVWRPTSDHPGEGYWEDIPVVDPDDFSPPGGA